MSAARATSKPRSFGRLEIPIFGSPKTSCACCAQYVLLHALITRLNPQPSPSIQKLAFQIDQVSRERVRDELTRMLTEGHAKRAFELLDETGLLREVLPEIDAMKGVEQPPEFHPEGDVFVHTLLMLEKLPQPCPTDARLGSAVARRGQAPDLPPCSRSHPLRRARSRGNENG